MFKVQHRSDGAWVDFALSDGAVRRHERFLDAAAWLAEFAFEATMDAMTNGQKPPVALDLTGFRIVDTLRNEAYQMLQSHDYRRESDGAIFDFLGAPAGGELALPPDLLPIPYSRRAS